MIPHNQPFISDADRCAVDAVLRSGWIAQGPEVEALESEFNSYMGGGKSCAVSSGTAALFMALKGLGIQPGDVVAVPTYSCSALLNAVEMTGGRIQVVDVREDDFTIDPASLARGGITARAVIGVHCFGAPADIAALKNLVPIVVEDCCQSLGTQIDRCPLGGAGDAAVFSFYATKIITGGQGGMVWDRSGSLAEAAHDYRQFDNRKTWEPRFNFQMTDIQAAMIRTQFARLDEIRARRKEIQARFTAQLPDGIGKQAGLDGPDTLPYRFVIRFSNAEIRDSAVAHFTRKNIKTIIPVERFELLHRYLNLDPAGFPRAENLVDTTLSIPLYPALDDRQVDVICAALSELGAA